MGQMVEPLTYYISDLIDTSIAFVEKVSKNTGVLQSSKALDLSDYKP